MKFPNESECFALLKEYGVPEEVVKHSLEVKENAAKIANDLLEKGVEVDIDLVKSAALLHDIGRWKYSFQKGCTSEKEGRKHIIESYDLLLKLGYKEFAKICAAHALGGLSREESKILLEKEIDLVPDSTEAKIINVADKINNKRKTLKEVLKFYTSQKYRERFYDDCPGLEEKAVKRFTKIWNDLGL